MSDAWVQTFTGRKFDVLEPDPAAVCIEDIAHALSLQCRFNGHSRRFYSVAEHSVLVSRQLGEDRGLWGLLHDAAEAYLGDIVAPIKRRLMMWSAGGVPCRLNGFDLVEADVDRVIREALIPPGYPAALEGTVADADKRALATEVRDLLGPAPEPWAGLDGVEPLDTWIQPHVPYLAELWFLERHRALVRCHQEGERGGDGR